MSELIERLRLAAEDAAGGPPSAEQVDALVELVDALEAELAARQPSEDDRTPEFEANEQELFKHQPVLSMDDGSIRGCQCMDRVFYRKTEDWGTHLAEVFDRLSRAAVPDAATEARIERWMQLVGKGVEERMDAEAERDAALAAIERVTRAKLEVDSVHQFHGNDCLCGFSSARSRSRTEHITGALLAALDGAPEPEEKP